MVINRIIIIIISYKHGQSFDWFLFCKNCKYVAKFVFMLLHLCHVSACVRVRVCLLQNFYKQTHQQRAYSPTASHRTHTHPSSTYLHITYTSDSDSRGIKCITTISVNICGMKKFITRKRFAARPALSTNEAVHWLLLDKVLVEGGWGGKGGVEMLYHAYDVPMSGRIWYVSKINYRCPRYSLSLSLYSQIGQTENSKLSNPTLFS